MMLVQLKLPRWFNPKIIMYLNMVGFNAYVLPSRRGPVFHINKKEEQKKLDAFSFVVKD